MYAIANEFATIAINIFWVLPLLREIIILSECLAEPFFHVRQRLETVDNGVVLDPTTSSLYLFGQQEEELRNLHDARIILF